jgi:hypothetical protein
MLLATFNHCLRRVLIHIYPLLGSTAQDAGKYPDTNVIMADHNALSEDRPSSPEAQPRGSRRERRWSGSKSTATTELHELKSLSTLKRHQPKPDRFPRPSNFQSFWEETVASASAPVNDDRLAPGATNAISQHGQKLSLRRPWLPSHPAGEDESTTRKDLNIRLHDISQSMWIEDPDNHSTERVYLTIEAAALDEMLTIDPSFCWMYVCTPREWRG